MVSLLQNVCKYLKVEWLIEQESEELNVEDEVVSVDDHEGEDGGVDVVVDGIGPVLPHEDGLAIVAGAGDDHQ